MRAVWRAEHGRARSRRGAGGRVRGRGAAGLPARDAKVRPWPHPAAGAAGRRPLHGAGLHHAPQPGADGKPPLRRKARQPPLGARQDENAHGRPPAARVGGAPAAQPCADPPPPRRGGGAGGRQRPAGRAHPLPARDRRHAASCLPRGVRLCQRARPARAGPVLRAAAEPDSAAEGCAQCGPARYCADGYARRSLRAHRPRHLRRTAVFRARGRHPPPRLQRGGRPPAQRARPRRADRRRARAARARAHRREKAQGRLQQGFWLLHRHSEQRGRHRVAGRLYPQADAGVERALFHARAQRPREHAPDGARAHRGAGVHALQRGAPARRGRGRARAGGGGRRCPARRAVLAGGDGGEKPLRLPRGRSLAHARYPRGASPRCRAGAEGQSLCPERHVPQRRGRPRRHRDRAEHGR